MDAVVSPSPADCIKNACLFTVHFTGLKKQAQNLQTSQVLTNGLLVHRIGSDSEIRKMAFWFHKVGSGYLQ